MEISTPRTKLCTVLIIGGLFARFGDALTDQSADASFERRAAVGPAACAPIGTNPQHITSTAIAAPARIITSDAAPSYSERCRNENFSDRVSLQPETDPHFDLERRRAILAD